MGFHDVNCFVILDVSKRPLYAFVIHCVEQFTAFDIYNSEIELVLWFKQKT